MLRAICLLSICYFMLQHLNAQQYGLLKDSRDGKVYKTVKIGEQEWMAENFDGTRFRNGDIIPQAKTIEEWRQAIREKKAVWCYNFQEGHKGSKLYSVWTAIDPRGIAPIGWRVPISEDVMKLNESFYIPKETPIKAEKKPEVIPSKNADTTLNEDEYVPTTKFIMPEEESFTVDFRSSPEEKYGKVSAGQKLRSPGWGNGTNESGFNGKPISGLNGNTGKTIWSGKGKGTYWWMQKTNNGSYQYMNLNELGDDMKAVMDSKRSGASTDLVYYYALLLRFIKD